MKESQSESTKAEQYLKSKKKRALDIVSCFCLFALSSPVFAITTLAVWVTQKENPFYTLTISGQQDAPIHMHKIKTMNNHMKSEINHPVECKKASDPRITKIGKILRKLSIDELPQLLDILIRGELSLVGNRPMFQTKVDALETYPTTQDIYQSWKESQNLSKRGLTGLTSIRGRALLDLTPMGTRKRLKLERFYNEHASLGFDIYIMRKTAMILLRGSGAF